MRAVGSALPLTILKTHVCSIIGQLGKAAGLYRIILDNMVIREKYRIFYRDICNIAYREEICIERGDVMLM